jgi:hypothetical protein
LLALLVYALNCCVEPRTSNKLSCSLFLVVVVVVGAKVLVLVLVGENDDDDEELILLLLLLLDGLDGVEGTAASLGLMLHACACEDTLAELDAAEEDEG